MAIDENWVVYRIVVEGKVQKVGYRYFISQMANSLSLCGFVRNLPEGNVYIEVLGSKPALDEFVLRCHQGPSDAQVSKVLVTTIANFSRKIGPFHGKGNFQIIR